MLGALLLLLLEPAAGLVCSICRHQGLSMVPPSAPRSRFVFNSPSAACLEELVVCAPSENFCLSAYGMPEPGNFWVQKGCVGGSLARSASGDAVSGQGCTEQILDLSEARNLPLPNPEQPLTLTVCACNDGDQCNAGVLQDAVSSSSGLTLAPALLGLIFAAELL